jgi:DNA repair exonuclease SbcCD nuclease subunit
MSLKFIHAADLHLDSPLIGLCKYPGAPDEQARGATRRALENLVDLALAEHVAFVLIAGDIYDGDWKDYNTGVFFSNQMARLREENIGAYILRGNHDAHSQISLQINLPDNVYEFSSKRSETKKLVELNIAIHGQSFATQSVPDDIAAQYPTAIPGFFNIGMLHTSASGYSTHETYAPCSISSLVGKGYDYWALGHVHQFKILNELPHVVFSGNTQGRNIRETGDKGCVLVEIDGKEVARVEHIRLDVLQWALLDVDVSGSLDIDDVVGRIVRELRLLAAKIDDASLIAARVTVTGACDAHASLCAQQDNLLANLRTSLFDEFGGRAWLEKLKLKTSPNIDLDAVAGRDDAVGQLLRSIRNVGVDQELMLELLSQFQDLKDRLPSVLTTGEGAIDLTSIDSIASRLPDVERDLAAYMLSEEAGS